MPVITDELISKVENGDDQRTYIMVRNIPSNFCKDQLISEFQESNLKTHETPELPFDKKNKSNPGYGFIVFWHPLFFVDFYRKYNKKNWQNTNSTKTIEFSYGRHEKKGKNLEQVEEQMAQSLNDIIKKYDIQVSLQDFKRKREMMQQCRLHRHQKSDSNNSAKGRRKNAQNRQANGPGFRGSDGRNVIAMEIPNSSITEEANEKEEEKNV